MALTKCRECGHRISTRAEACPSCGHPQRGGQNQMGQQPPCYSCSSPSTTRCHCCGKFSCATHLQNIYVRHGKSGAYELRCDSCYGDAVAMEVVRWLLVFFALCFVLILMVS